MAKKKVFVTRKIPESGLKLLRKKYDVRVWKKDRVISRGALLRGVKWCDALLCLLTDNIDKKVLDANPNLQIVANYAVGYNNIDHAYAKTKKIPVTNTPGVLTTAVAEHAMALLLSIARRVPESDTFVRKSKYKGWAPMLLLGGQLQGKTLGIVGAGRIGSAVAERAMKGFGMKIIYFNRSKNARIEKDTKAKRKAKLKELLKEADFVSVHVPLVKETRHLLGSSQLKAMKKTAYLINTSRGPVIDEKALVSALKSKQIAGAALDVFENEPKLAKGLSTLSNVVLTPHTASGTIETREAMSTIAAQNIIAVLSGKKPKNRVN
ncbi:TPA: D-glycerate dehydrogenase [Candidatus Woesearchaeota archaeon]|nr:D-glycerate dehydrogenase [archaeon]HIJ11175.1 D-glycerate dehydrogenase [Candidatus Woesearchaeota archaeon]